MSSSVIQSRASAMKYNAKSASSVGWGGNIPQAAIEKYPHLGSPSDSQAFALAVEAFQEDTYGAGAMVDGKLGMGTWTALLKRFDQVDDCQAYWVLNNRRVNVEVESPVEIINFDQSGGLDLHKFGHFSSRKGLKPSVIVVHWGGLDPHHCHRIFSSPDRQVSSHAGIGLSPEGKPTIYQYLDLNHKSWHAGFANTNSVGIDICQQPSLKWKSHYVKKGYNVTEMANTTGRGDSQVLTLDPNVALAVREAVKSLCAALDIPYQFPCGKEGRDYEGDFYHGVLDKDYLLNGFTGVIGHHHVVQKKWDCACWWETLFGAK
jgi:hypothetical protein